MRQETFAWRRWCMIAPCDRRAFACLGREFERRLEEVYEKPQRRVDAREALRRSDALIPVIANCLSDDGAILLFDPRRSLQAEHLKPALAAVEAKVPVRSPLQAAALKSLADHFRAVPDYRGRMGQYPLFALLGIVACAYLAGAPRGQKDLAAFARRLSSRQRAALGVRRTASGEYPAPSQPTFCRLFARVSEQQIEQALLAHQAQVRGAPPKHELVVLDGKVPGHSGGLNVVTAVTAPSLHYLGSEVVAEKTNEIPAVRALCQRLELAGRLVSIDALHTQSETARQLVLEHGGDYLMTVKANQPALQAVVQAQVPDPGAPLLPR